MKQIGDYELKEEMGSGAYGAVYRAYQPGMDREVAVKVIQPRHANEAGFVARFAAEAQLVVKLEHPHIVPIYDYWQDEEGAYLVMRLLAGGTLKDQLRAGPLGPAATAMMAEQICSALAAAHKQGVIHRDLKPSNILFDEDGNAYLTDFGIAKNLEAEVKLTPTGAVLGTPDYISPEQIRGEPLTAAADQYSLGIVLYETLTGRVPFPDESIATLFHKHLSEPLPLASERRPDLRPQLDRVLQRATAKDPNERYPNALSLARVLKEALEGGQRPVPGGQPPSFVPHSSALSNLPAQPTPFIGRERQVEEVMDLLNKARLVTLTGPGGTGKTRLSLQVAGLAAGNYTDGVTFVGLASTTDYALVPNAIAHEIGVAEQPDRPLVEILGRFFGVKEALLVLDSYEHLMDAAPLVSDLLTAASQLTVLVTSREVLRLNGEHEYPVPPLSVPDPEQAGSLADLSFNESVTLFVQRAQAASPNFQLTEANAPAAAAICIRLDGLPLAIELAAARVKLFSPQQLLERLESRFRLLTGGARDLPARQRTLRDTIDWSYNLLSEDEQRFFARLAVFTGGRSFEAVESVCGPGLNIDSLNGLESLINKSLLYRGEGPGGEPRFIMLETIQEYARERLAGGVEEQQVRDRHLHYFAALAEEMEPGYRRHGQLLLLDQTEAELGNLRAAFDWAMVSGNFESGARLVASLEYFLHYRDHFVEGYQWIGRVLEEIQSIPRKHKMRLLLTAGRIAYINGELAESERISKRALAIAQDLGDRRREAWALNYMGAASVSRLNVEGIERAVKYCEDALSIFRELEDKPGMAQSLTNLGNLARETCDYDRAREAYEECMTVCQETGEIIRQTITMINLAYVAYREGEYRRAQTLTISGLRIKDRSTTNQVSLLAVLAGSLSMLRQPMKAVRLLGACAKILNDMGAEYDPSDRIVIAKMTDDLRGTLNEDDFEAAWAEGQEMTLEQAVAYALDE